MRVRELLVLGCLVGAGNVWSETINVFGTANVESADAGLFPGVSMNDTVGFSFDIDATPSDNAPGDLNVGEYLASITNVRVFIRGSNFSVRSNSPMDLIIINDLAFASQDNIIIDSDGLQSVTLFDQGQPDRDLAFFFELADFDMTVLSSDAIPDPFPIDLSEIENPNLVIGNDDLFCTVTSVCATKDGAVDTSFNPSVTNLSSGGFIGTAHDGGYLLGGGAAGILKLGPDGMLDTGFNPALSGMTSGDVLLHRVNHGEEERFVLVDEIGGEFRVVRLLGDGSLDSGFSSGAINSTSPFFFFATILPTRDGGYLVEGDFDQVGGVPRGGLAKLNHQGMLDPSFAPMLTFGGPGGFVSMNGGASSTSQIFFSAERKPFSDGSILLLGNFTEIDGRPAPGNARITADCEVDTSFNPAIGGSFGSVFAIEGRSPNGTLRYVMLGNPGFGALRQDGSLDPTFNPPAATSNGQPSGFFPELVQPDGKTIVTGGFDMAGGVPRPGLARLNIDGSLDLGFTPPAFGSNGGGPAFIAIEFIQPDGKIVVSGQFDTVDGQPQENIARLRPDGSFDEDFRPKIATTQFGFVTYNLQPDGSILLVGGIEFVNEQPVPGIARLLNKSAKPPNTYAAFRALRFPPGTPAADMLPTADPEKDGVINLFEYLFVGDPLKPDPWQMPRPFMDGIEFDQNMYATDVDVAAEYSRDGRTWETRGLFEQGSGELADRGLTTRRRFRRGVTSLDWLFRITATLTSNP